MRRVGLYPASVRRTPKEMTMRTIKNVPVAALWGALLIGSAVQAVEVPAGNVAALKAAIELANESSAPTNLALRGTYRFTANDPLPPITGDLLFQANGGVPVIFTTYDGQGPDQLLRVEANGRLELELIHFSRFPLSALQSNEPLIENHGTLVIRNARFENMVGIPGGGFCCSQDQDPLIDNHGQLEMNRVIFFDVVNQRYVGSLLANRGGTVELREILTASTREGSRAVANHAGHVRITNATFGANEGAIFTGEGALTELANTIIRKTTGPLAGSSTGIACVGPVTSLGHNLIEDESCALDAPGDLQGIPSGTFPPRLERHSDGILSPVIGLAAASPAVDSADPQFCGRFDVLGTGRAIDGDNDGERGCDRGAVELSQRLLSDGGINGFYHAPDADGHYITILDNVHNTLVIWNTFDRDGNQAWIFGVGQLVNGRSIIANAYTNENGMLTDMGPVDTELAIPWGTLTVELDSCTHGRLVFESDRPEFGHGDFEFERLASTRQLGCTD